MPAQQPQPGDRHQSQGRFGQRAVPVEEFLDNPGHRAFIGRRGQPPVGLQPQPVAADVVRRQVGIDRQVDADILGLLGGDDGLAVSSSPKRFDRLADQAHVQIETHPGHMPGLLDSKNIAGATNLQVFQRNCHTGAEFVVLGDGGQPVVGGLAERGVARIQEVGVPAFAAAPHPAAQLVQLGQPERVGSLDDQGVGIGDVQAGLDDRRAHQDVELTVPEPLHGGFESLLGHLAMRHSDSRLGHQFADPTRGVVDGANPVMHVEHLPVAQQFAAQRRGHLLVVVLADVGEHRVALLGRGEDGGHLTDAGQAHLQRAWDGGGAHGEHVDVAAEGFDVLLVLDAEALLLVDHHQTEVFPPDTGLQQPVSSDDDVDAAVGHALQRFSRLAPVGEPGQPPDRHRKSGHTRGEGL